MGKKRQTAVWLLAGNLLLAHAIPVMAAEDAAAGAVKTDAQTMEELGVLQGEGGGVSAAYLAKPATRMQAALLFLRLKGLESEALRYKGTAGFTDAGEVNESNQAVLGYLQANPQWGWSGTGGGRFEPGAPVTAQQYYKVLLEALGYRQDSDFTYEDTLTFARSLGLSQAADAGALRNGHIASATVEALAARLKGSDTTLLASLANQNVVDAAKASGVPAKAVTIANNAQLGPYLVDEKGMTLYMFMKDTPNVSACKEPMCGQLARLLRRFAAHFRGIECCGFRDDRPGGRDQTNHLPRHAFILFRS
ncbi:hypothetical protein ACHHV8_09835 [Paenibacillus sp. TAB 01]|uniref:hypothetical protein n=1 Tax=Paenibacillus sp. TAB 01 TaxID=3368988 RepID=UPI003751E50D